MILTSIFIFTPHPVLSFFHVIFCHSIILGNKPSLNTFRYPISLFVSTINSKNSSVIIRINSIVLDYSVYVSASLQYPTHS